MYDEFSANFDQKLKDKRFCRRKAPKRGVKAECRRGMHGLGKNLVLEIVDLSDGGICLKLTEEFVSNEVAEIIINGVGRSKPLKCLADVRWAMMVDEESFHVGFRFRKKIPYGELNQFI